MLTGAIYQTIRREGAAACRAGKYLSDNPYDRISQPGPFIAWGAAWCRQKRSMVKSEEKGLKS